MLVSRAALVPGAAFRLGLELTKFLLSQGGVLPWQKLSLLESRFPNY